MSRGSTPRHAQTAGDLGFAIQFNPWHLAAVSPYRDPQLQVGENYSYMFNL